MLLLDTDKTSLGAENLYVDSEGPFIGRVQESTFR